MLWVSAKFVPRLLTEDLKIRCVEHLLHDSAPANTALSIQEFLVKHSIHVLSQPPYLSDLSLPDFLLFPKIEISNGSGHHYENNR
jgi:hypothetical protein